MLFPIIWQLIIAIGYKYYKYYNSLLLNGILEKEEIITCQRRVLQPAQFYSSGEQAGKELQIYRLGASSLPK